MKIQTSLIISGFIFCLVILVTTLQHRKIMAVWKKAISLRSTRHPLSNYAPNRTSADFAALIDAIKAEGRAYRSEEKSEDSGAKVREWITIILIGLTFLAILAQLNEMIKVYGPIKDQADAAKASADAAIKQAESSQSALIQSQRAWVGPQNASLVAVPTVARPVEIRIGYNNYGHGPASNLIWAIEPFIIHAGEEVTAAEKLDVYMKACRNLIPPQGGGIAYPTAGGFGASGYTLSTKTKDDFVTDAITKGDDIIVVQGCFAYQTFDEPKHSYFCYFYKQGTTEIANMNLCATGHEAN